MCHSCTVSVVLILIAEDQCQYSALRARISMHLLITIVKLQELSVHYI